MHRYPGIPHILDVVLRDATLYFMLSTVFQVLLVFFEIFAPVGDTRHTRGFLITLCSSCVLCMFSWEFSSFLGCKPYFS